MATTVFMTGANKTGTMVTITVRYRNFPDKSYITNRFNIQCQRTTETKMKFNAKNDDQDARRLIRRIDEMIRELI